MREDSHESDDERYEQDRDFRDRSWRRPWRRHWKGYWREHRWAGRGPFAWFGLGVAGLVGIVVIAFLFGFFVMLLWNKLMPELFGLKTIMYWQAVGLIILAKLLIAPFAPPSGKHRHYHVSPDMNCDDWEVRGGWDKWRYYGDYWKEQGKVAFEKYVEERMSRSAENRRTRKSGSPE